MAGGIWEVAGTLKLIGCGCGLWLWAVAVAVAVAKDITWVYILQYV